MLLSGIRIKIKNSVAKKMTLRSLRLHAVVNKLSFSSCKVIMTTYLEHTPNHRSTLMVTPICRLWLLVKVLFLVLAIKRGSNSSFMTQIHLYGQIVMEGKMLLFSAFKVEAKSQGQKIGMMAINLHHHAPVNKDTMSQLTIKVSIS